MTKISRIIVSIILATLLASTVFTVQAKSRHEMCEIAEMAIQTISQKLGTLLKLRLKKEVLFTTNASLHHCLVLKKPIVIY